MKEVDVQAWVNALPDPKSTGKVTRDFKEVLKGRMEFYTTVLLHQSVGHLRGSGASIKDVKEMKESLKELREKDEDRTELIRSILRKMTPASQNEEKTPLIIS